MDDIPNEFIKEGGPMLRKALTKIFEMMRETEWTPEDWASERLKILHKGKSRYDLDNYRGISISSNIGKVFTRILAQRLETVIEREGWLGEMQGGFRRGRGTMDNLFVLTSIMDRAHKMKKPLYIAFLDLRKAFDRVWREGLWQCLDELGLGGKFLSLVKSLYNNHKRTINTSGGYTEWIHCNRGVKQGCVLSPMLFALYIAKLGDILLEDPQGVEVGGTNIPGLFFADDMALMAESRENLIALIRKVRKFTREKRLEINYAKTQIMKMGPGTAQEVKWTFQGAPDMPDTKSDSIEETNVYEYLGMLLGRNRTFTQFLTSSFWKILKFRWLEMAFPAF